MIGGSRGATARGTEELVSREGDVESRMLSIQVASEFLDGEGKGEPSKEKEEPM